MLCYIKNKTLILKLVLFHFLVDFFFISEAGIGYEHPSKYWLMVQASNKTLTSSFSDGMLNIAQMESQMMVCFFMFCVVCA